jgi:hypothetical protein
LHYEQFYHTNNPAPDIHSYRHGYTNDPLNKALESNNFSDKELDRVGFKVDDKRGRPDRAGNAGRMNVRGNPLQQGGVLSTVRSDVDGSFMYTGIAGTTVGANGQQYINDQFYNFNAYKGQPGRCDLDTAKKQLAGNPFAHTISQ